MTGAPAPEVADTPSPDTPSPVEGPPAETFEETGEALPWPATEIVPGLWQSGYPEPGEDWDAVVDLDVGRSRLEDVGLYVRWRIEDAPVEPDRAALVAIADLVADLRRAGKRVLVHCAAGINRSGLLAAAVLMREGLSADDAIAAVRSRRPGALNNATFVRLLRGGL